MTYYLQTYAHNPRILSLIGKILANICLHPQHHTTLFRWVVDTEKRNWNQQNQRQTERFGRKRSQTTVMDDIKTKMVLWIQKLMSYLSFDR
jgi:hypothetical protein